MKRAPNTAAFALWTSIGPVALAGSTLLNLIIIASMWGRWRAVAILVAVQVARVVVNWGGDRLARRHGIGADGLPLWLGNALLGLVLYHTAGWSIPALLYVCFHFVVSATFDDAQRWWRLPAMIAATATLALLDGVAPLVVASAVATAVVLFVISDRRTSALRQTLGRLDAERTRLRAAHAELKAMQEHLIQQEKLSSLGLMAAEIAHEINNPMSYVTGNVYTLKRDLPRWSQLTEAERHEYLDDVLPSTMEGIERVNVIVGDLRRFARGEPEKVVPYSLNEELQAALRLCNGELRRRDARLTLELGELPVMTGRPRQIGQVVVNLVVNAAQAVARGGAIRVRTAWDGERALLSVSDDGTGISPEVRARLFQPFFTTKPAGEGTGLGLSVVHGIVASHAGTIEVTSEAGCGATFTVRLPPRPQGLTPKAVEAVAASAR